MRVKGGGTRVGVVKRQKLPALRQISPGDVMYMMTTVNDTVLYL